MPNWTVQLGRVLRFMWFQRVGCGGVVRLVKKSLQKDQDFIQVLKMYCPQGSKDEKRGAWGGSGQRYSQGNRCIRIWCLSHPCRAFSTSYTGKIRWILCLHFTDEETDSKFLLFQTTSFAVLCYSNSKKLTLQQFYHAESALTEEPGV